MENSSKVGQIRSKLHSLEVNRMRCKKFEKFRILPDILKSGLLEMTCYFFLIIHLSFHFWQQLSTTSTVIFSHGRHIKFWFLNWPFSL